MKKAKNIALLKDAPVAKALIKLGIPTMVGMMVSSLYNLVDTYFVGIIGTSQQAAVSAVFPLSLVMLGITGQLQSSVQVILLHLTQSTAK